VTDTGVCHRRFGNKATISRFI